MQECPTVLILKSCRIDAEALHRYVLAVAPGACCMISGRVRDVRRELQAQAFDLILTGVGALDGDILDVLFLLQRQRQQTWRNVLVVTQRRGVRLVSSFRDLGIGGIFDSETDTPEILSDAIRTVLAMNHYWSDSIRRVLACPTPDDLRLRLLTTSEQLVFGALGNGSDDAAVAELLGMAISTVQSHRKSIYCALRLHGQWDLVCAAEKYGFARFIRGGCVRIGFGLLLHAYQNSSQRPRPLTAALQALYPELVLRGETPRQPRVTPQKLTLNLG